MGKIFKILTQISILSIILESVPVEEDYFLFLLLYEEIHPKNVLISTHVQLLGQRIKQSVKSVPLHVRARALERLWVVSERSLH